jgi:solute carrier family 1 (high affinity glutamate transporter) protein 1
MSSNKILIAILIGIAFGALLGGFWPEAGLELQFLGEFFLKALFILVVPLVIASIIVGVTALGDVRRIGGTGGRTIAFYMITTALSVLVGIILVNIVSSYSRSSSGRC